MDMEMQRTDISNRPIPTVRQAAGNPLMVTIARAAKSARSTGQVRYVYAGHGGFRIAEVEPQAPVAHWAFGPNGEAWKAEVQLPASAA
jgi:hypothetical protein